MTAHWNQQLSMYTFFKVIECLVKRNTQVNISIRKQFNHKKPSSSKQMNRVQNIWTKVWKYQAFEFLEIQIVNVSTCSIFFYLSVLS